MNIERNLILIKNEDKTEQITDCSKITNGKRDITFKNNKTYTYSSYNVEWSRNCIDIDPNAVIVYEKGIPISNVIKIIKFEELGYIRLIFKTGYNKLYHKSELDIQNNSLNDPNCKNHFSYLKELAANLDLENDNEFISKQFESIAAISPNSVLAKYLCRENINKLNYNNEIIFPFGFNISQKEATEKALTNQISVIEGPPGTGKTQTILNIIANVIMEEKTVAVVSNNNSATLNVLEKLKKYNVDFIAAYLGNKQNKTEFFETQNSKYPNIVGCDLSHDNIENIKSNLINSKNLLEQMLENKNKLAIAEMKKSELVTENDHFKKYSDNELQLSKALPRQISDEIMSLLLDYNMSIQKYGYIKFLHKLKFLIKYSIWNFRFYDNSPEIISTYLQQLYYKLKLEELNKEIESLENKLKKYNFDNEMKKYSENSITLLKYTLNKRYDTSKDRTIFDKDILWKDFGTFIKEYPVILSTTHSLRSCISKNYLFDYVIIDEASQVDIVTGALAFSCAKNVVIVGDLKQLPNVVNNKTKEISNNIYNRYKLHEAYNYSENSLLSSICKLFNDAPKTLLKEHYRCHPKIIDFCNKKFYNNQLIILTDENSCNSPLEVYKTVKGNHERNHYNQRQIDVIVKEILPRLKGKESIGIISPYRNQIEKLRSEINEENIEVDTVHKYQGREKKIILLSTVSDKRDEFMDDANLLNVAISRAEDKLIIVVSDNDELLNNSNIGDLIRYIEYNNLEIINSNLHSIFDLLYSSYSEKLLEFLKKNKKVSKYNSENLMNALIEKTLDYEEFKSLGKVLHYPLKMLIRDTSKLDEKEFKYVANSLTHIDFFIFRKIDKAPVLVVEVDGYAFHANNPKQLERDRMKDEILEKYNIPILRLPTNGSGEEDILKEKLVKVLVN